MRRAPSADLLQLGARLREAASLVLWRQDGVLALRSGDVNHLPHQVAAVVREVAAVDAVRQTAAVLALSADQLAIALLTRAAILTRGLARPARSAFPDRAPPPFERLASDMEVSVNWPILLSALLLGRRHPVRRVRCLRHGGIRAAPN
jgi:hypothetical protein